VSNRWVIDGLRHMASGATPVVPAHLRIAAARLEASDERVAELEEYIRLVGGGLDTCSARAVAQILAKYRFELSAYASRSAKSPPRRAKRKT
jgi:hypothetical protein